jgi:signal transduction histidine kinase
MSHAVLPFASPKPHPFRLVPGGANDQVESLLSAVAGLQERADGESLETVAVEAAERALPGAAAALFSVAADTDLLVMRAAGPRWRTGEREGPAWLSGLAGVLAATARSPQPLSGRLSQAIGDRGQVDIAQAPLVAPGWGRGALVVTWPPASPARAGDPWWVERFAVHLQLALRDRGGEAEAAALRQAQADMVRSQQLRALGAMAGGVIHDLNNGLTTILGLSQWLAQSPGLGAEAVSDIEAIGLAGTEMMRLTADLELLARQGRPPARTPIDLTDVLAAAIDGVTPLLEARRAEATPVGVDVSRTGDRHTVAGDLVVLRESIACLLRSAIDATPGGSSVEVHLSSGVATIRLTVADGGASSDETAVTGIFEPIYAKATKWRGLGLAACWGAADAHGGRLEAELLPGGCRRFVLTLPAATAR